MLKELPKKMKKEFIDNADQLDGEERHRACPQLMFINKIEDEFNQLKQKNDKLKNKKVMEQKKKLEFQMKEMEQENKRWRLESSQFDEKASFYNRRNLIKANHFPQKNLN